MHELGDLLSEEEIAAFMAIMDVNNDGVIGVRGGMLGRRGGRGGHGVGHSCSAVRLGFGPLAEGCTVGWVAPERRLGQLTAAHGVAGMLEQQPPATCARPLPLVLFLPTVDPPRTRCISGMGTTSLPHRCQA